MTQSRYFAALLRRMIPLLVLGLTLVSMAAAQVRAWGSNTFGECTVPSGLTGPIAISVAGPHTMALQSNGIVRCWGYNVHGESNVPSDLTWVTSIAAGIYHSMALQSNGTVRCWGDSTYGACIVPGGLTGVTAIASGGFHSIALRSNGAVWCWGNNFRGQCNVPPDLGRVIAIAGGANHSMALQSDGTVRCWGDDTDGQCDVPGGLNGVIAIGAGFYHSMAVKSDGTVVCWGNNSLGQSHVPSGLTGVTAVAGGYGHSMALKSNGTVVCWGDNSKGQSVVPGDVTGVTAIGGGLTHSVVLLTSPTPPATLTTNHPDFIGGATTKVSGTITFKAPTGSKETVALSCSDSHVQVPASIVVRAGLTTVSFPVTHTPVTAQTDAVVTANLASGPVFVRLHLEPLVVKSLVLTPNKGEGGNSFNAVVTLNANPAVPVSVALTSSDPSAPVPASIEASADIASRTFAINTLEVTSAKNVTIEASFGGITKSALLTLYAKPRIKLFSFSKGNVFGNQKVQGQVYLDVPARVGGMTIAIASGAGLSSPSSITIPEGQRMGTFDILVDDVASASTPNVTVSTTNSVYVKSLTIKPLLVTSVSLSPSSVKGGDSSSVTVTLGGVVAIDTVVDLSSSLSGAQVPATLIIPAGASSATATITTTAVTQVKSSTIKAGRNGISKTQSLTINP